MNDYQAEPIASQENTPRRKQLLRFLLELFQTLAIALVLYFLIDAVIARVKVENISMRPTLKPGEYLIVSKLAYRLGEFERGDVVVFHHSATEDYIKRIIGVPGDRVDISGGEVTVNGEILDEPYISAPPDYAGAWEVPEGMLFVLGDNRNLSSDSHRWGFVPQESVVGRALVIYWPLGEVKLLTHPVVVSANN